MNPDLLNRLLELLMLNLAVVLTGYMLIRRNWIMLSWLLLIVSIFLAFMMVDSLHPAVRMLGLIVTTFTAMKVIAVTATYFGKPLLLTFKQWLTFAVGWAGMRAQPFEKLGNTKAAGAGKMMLFGFSRIVFGSVFIVIAQFLHDSLPQSLVSDLGCNALLLIGCSLILHFGLLGISAGVWRLRGVPTLLLFNEPARALSLTEFWSKRWNLAFSEMTAIAVYRPLKRKIGQGPALLAAFLFSGLLHELALSVPVNSGYGLPTTYFLLHGCLVILEKKMTDGGIAFLKNRITAKVWLFFWLVAPAPLLFHDAFIKQVLWPLCGLRQ